MVGQAFVKLVEEFRGLISVQRICELMGVARATYYRWIKQKGTQTTKEKRNQDIGEKCAEHKYRYGYPDTPPPKGRGLSFSESL